jgi:hypothetical protein
LGKFFGGNAETQVDSQFTAAPADEWKIGDAEYSPPQLDDSSSASTVPPTNDPELESSPPRVDPRESLKSGLTGESPLNDLRRGLSEQDRIDAAEGPHAALHAKLRRLRRQAAQDQSPPGDR